MMFYHDDHEADQAIRESYNMMMLDDKSQYYAINALAEQYRADVQWIIESLDRTKDRAID